MKIALFTSYTTTCIIVSNFAFQCCSLLFDCRFYIFTRLYVNLNVNHQQDQTYSFHYLYFMRYTVATLKKNRQVIRHNHYAFIHHYISRQRPLHIIPPARPERIQLPNLREPGHAVLSLLLLRGAVLQAGQHGRVLEQRDVDPLAVLGAVKHLPEVSQLGGDEFDAVVGGEAGYNGGAGVDDRGHEELVVEPGGLGVGEGIGVYGVGDELEFCIC